ncbi:uncharacterized protein [Venturia canescens]|uniref:uncharacterized protein n=1 Tax=Venturia canescens TaxID=32260 RepID=UPI001C9CFE1C|nr:uncharacterized protein LOC122417759 [Venturia canescens]
MQPPPANSTRQRQRGGGSSHVVRRSRRLRPVPIGPERVHEPVAPREERERTPGTSMMNRPHVMRTEPPEQARGGLYSEQQRWNRREQSFRNAQARVVDLLFNISNPYRGRRLQRGRGQNLQ